MSFSPYKLVSQLAANPELAALGVLNTALKQAACSMLAQHQDIGSEEEELPVTALARAIVTSAFDLQELLRRYRAALARYYRDKPFRSP